MLQHVNTVNVAVCGLPELYIYIISYNIIIITIIIIIRIIIIIIIIIILLLYYII